MSNHFVNIVVLAAGEASRFGGPKQLACLNGRSLLQISADFTTGLQALLAGQGMAVRSCVVLGAHQERIRSEANFSAWDEVLWCSEWHLGMQQTIFHAFSELDARELADGHECCGTLVLLVDQPFLSAQDVAELVKTGIAGQVITCSDYASESNVSNGLINDNKDPRKDVGVPVFFPRHEMAAFVRWYEQQSSPMHGGAKAGAKKFIMQREYRSMPVAGIGLDIDTKEDLQRLSN